MNELIREMLVLLGDEANRSAISVCSALVAELPIVTADRVQLQQVFMKLMLNGIESIKEVSGKLTITSQRIVDGQVLISVSDTVVGLPADKSDRIFDFFTTKPQGSQPRGSRPTGEADRKTVGSFRTGSKKGTL